MNHFDAVKLCSVVTELSVISAAAGAAKHASGMFYKAVAESVGEDRDPPAVNLDEGAAAIAIACLNNARAICVSAGLNDAESRIKFILGRVTPDGSTHDYSSLPVELDHAREAIVSDLEKRAFLYIRPARLGYCENRDLLGAAVSSAFPSAVPDIVEVGNCMAAECNTAGVFHLMRVVEWGLRALSGHVGIRRVRAKIKKSGRVIYTPIEYSEWEKILDELQERVDAKIGRMKRGTAKQGYQQFFYPALQDIRGIRDAWRNHVMHTRDEYSHEDANAIFDHVKRLMGALATRVSEL